jgi:hypothetical protein
MMMNENFATKHDVQELRMATQHDIHELKSELNSMKLKARFDGLEHRLTINLAMIAAIAIGVTATLLKLIESSH